MQGRGILFLQRLNAGDAVDDGFENKHANKHFHDDGAYAAIKC